MSLISPAKFSTTASDNAISTTTGINSWKNVVPPSVLINSFNVSEFKFKTSNFSFKLTTCKAFLTVCNNGTRSFSQSTVFTNSFKFINPASFIHAWIASICPAYSKATGIIDWTSSEVAKTSNNASSSSSFSFQISKGICLVASYVGATISTISISFTSSSRTYTTPSSVSTLNAESKILSEIDLPKISSEDWSILTNKLSSIAWTTSKTQSIIEPSTWEPNVISSIASTVSSSTVSTTDTIPVIGAQIKITIKKLFNNPTPAPKQRLVTLLLPIILHFGVSCSSLFVTTVSSSFSSLFSFLSLRHTRTISLTMKLIKRTNPLNMKAIIVPNTKYNPLTTVLTTFMYKLYVSVPSIRISFSPNWFCPKYKLTSRHVCNSPGVPKEPLTIPDNPKTIFLSREALPPKITHNKPRITTNSVKHLSSRFKPDKKPKSAPSANTRIITSPKISTIKLEFGIS